MRVWGLGLRVWCLGFKVGVWGLGLGFVIWGRELRVWDLGLRVWEWELRVRGGWRVPGIFLGPPQQFLLLRASPLSPLRISAPLLPSRSLGGEFEETLRAVCV